MQDADEIASEGQMDKAVWLLEPDNDESQYLVGPERWPAEERLDRESLAKEVCPLLSYFMVLSLPPVAH